MSDRACVLVVDDDRELCELLTLRLERQGYDGVFAHDVTTALERVERERFDAVLLDLRLGDEDGFAVLDGIAQRAPDVPVIVLTAHGTIETAVEAMRRGAFGFATKPFHNQDLLQRIAHAIESHRLRREVAGLRRVLDSDGDDQQLIGVSAAIEQVRRTISRVARTDTNVLVLGESGSGKHLVARQIHASSRRSEGPFVAVNCTGVASELLESALFGHVAGAFPGATMDREGLLLAARAGTLFLDEVSEVPPVAQAKLLRVLDDQVFAPLGSTVEHRVDVRIVAATNRDLRQEVVEKRFREDLYYRLHVVPISVPPLRDRKGDVTILADLFLQRAASRHGIPVPRMGSRALTALVGHAWPGNVRELANVIEAAVLLCRDGSIDVEHLAGVALAAPAPASAADEFRRAAGGLFDTLSDPTTSDIPSLRDVRDIVDRAYLETVLARSGGNVSLAAKLAGRNRTDFYDLLRRHALVASAFKRE